MPRRRARPAAASGSSRTRRILPRPCRETRSSAITPTWFSSNRPSEQITTAAAAAAAKAAAEAAAKMRANPAIPTSPAIPTTRCSLSVRRLRMVTARPRVHSSAKAGVSAPWSNFARPIQTQLRRSRRCRLLNFSTVSRPSPVAGTRAPLLLPVAYPSSQTTSGSPYLLRLTAAAPVERGRSWELGPRWRTSASPTPRSTTTVPTRPEKTETRPTPYAAAAPALGRGEVPLWSTRTSALLGPTPPQSRQRALRSTSILD